MRRASIAALLVVTMVTGCDSGNEPTRAKPSPPVSPSATFAPPSGAAGWTVQAYQVETKASPSQLALAASPAGAVVAGTFVPGGSTKGNPDRGEPSAHVWRCAAEPCRPVSALVEPNSILTHTNAGFISAFDSGGQIRVTRCTYLDCRSDPASYPTVPTGYGTLLGVAADGAHVVSLTSVRGAGPPTVQVASCPNGACGAARQPVATGEYSWWIDADVAVAVQAGQVAVATGNREKTGQEKVVTLQMCADPACGRLGRRVDVTGLTDPYPLSLRILPDGRPVILAGRDLMTCTDPACSGNVVTPIGVPEHNYVTAALGIGPAGLPIVAAVTAGTVRLHTCTDRLCRTTTDTLVSTTTPRIAELAVGAAADGTTYVAWLSREAMVLFRCAHAPCG